MSLYISKVFDRYNFLLYFKLYFLNDILNEIILDFFK